MSKDELYEKLGKMDINGLWAYHNSAKVTSLFIGTAGVTILLLMIIFYNFLFLFGGSILVYFLAQTSAGISNTINFIEERIIELSDK